MLKVSYADCRSPSLVISVQFTLEMCVTAKNRQKIHLKNSILAFKVIQDHFF